MSWTTPAESGERFALHRDPTPERVATFAEDVAAGLRAQPYHLSPKYFYDDLGSSLFEAITRLPEYYLTVARSLPHLTNRSNWWNWVRGVLLRPA